MLACGGGSVLDGCKFFVVAALYEGNGLEIYIWRFDQSAVSFCIFLKYS
ncbi:hypothetical protein [[Mannheimia] succiniciproducens]|nr:hypothetical protein [[Mannheimia] succiniciproducens]